MKRLKLVQSLVRHSDGSAAVELAFVIPLVVMMLLGIVEFGQIHWARHALQFGCDQGIRYALANPDASMSAIETVVRNNIAGFAPEALDISVVPETVATVPFLDVSASYTYTLTLAFVDLGTVDVLARARAPLGTPPPPI